MKLLKYILLVISCSCFSQDLRYDFYLITFEDTIENNRITIDTISNSSNCWQIGPPQKDHLSEAYSSPNVIITDTVNSYPVNDTSVFTVTHIQGLAFTDRKGLAVLSGYYKVDSDSLNDYGLLEFSPDKGNHWIDILNDTLDQYLFWNSPKPVLTGTSGWTYFWVNLAELGPGDSNYRDTILYRFSFISDGIQDNRDGLMFDDLDFIDWHEGISPNRLNSFHSIVYPNPGNQWLVIEFDNSHFQTYELEIMDGEGKLVFKKGGIETEQIEIHVSKYSSGTYFYRLLNRDSKFVSHGKFIVN